MSRDEIRKNLEDAILRCRITARRTMEQGLTYENRRQAEAEDGKALGEVWDWIERLG